ncbi:ileal sodium/bile acid cotransporter-like [Ptychodera flava]|uniref:ileal sodium/bile acid cotransporter-like n=1 Tax=Ptychodera flava TaxID=63121 RepID=UPI00396A137E
MDTIEIVNTSHNNSLTNGTMMTGLAKPNKAIGLANQILIIAALIFVMIGMGCTTTVKQIWANLRRPYAIAIGAGCQFIVMPLIGFALAHAFQLDAGFALGALIMSCCPGGTLSNLFCYYSNSDVTLSICMTTLSTVLAIGLMPLNLLIYSRSWTNESTKVPYTDIMLSLVSILIPGGVGMLIRWKSEKIAAIVEKVCSAIAMVLVFICLIIQMVTNISLFSNFWKPWILALIYPAIGFAFGYVISLIFRLEGPKRRTVGFETGCQNVALALSVINLSFPPGLFTLQMLTIPSLFGLCMILDAVIFMSSFKIYKVLKKRRESKDGEAVVKSENDKKNADYKESGEKTAIPEYSIRGDVIVNSQTGNMVYATKEQEYRSAASNNVANQFNGTNDSIREISTQTFEQEGSEGRWDIIQPRKWIEQCHDHKAIVRSNAPASVYAEGLPNYGLDVENGDIDDVKPWEQRDANSNEAYTNEAFQHDVLFYPTPYLLGDGRVTWESSI